jgi:tetratricopeptide (TPR) repeat protein
MELADRNCSNRERFSTTVEVALLYDNHLNNVDSAFDYICKAFVLDPANEEVRNRMRSFAARAKKDKKYCEVIEGEIKKLRSVDRNETAADILFENADYLSENGKTKKALAIYWRMIDWYGDNDAITSRAINDIHSIDESNYSPEDKIKLANIELKIEKDPIKKREILFRIANTQENEIGSLKDAGATLTKILRIDENDKDALQALSRIYEREKRWNDLIEILKKLASIETEPKIKRDIFIRISKLATHM